MTTRSWLVERSKGVFEEVNSNYLSTNHGALEFRHDVFGPLQVVYAPGTWLTVVLDEDPYEPEDD